ncbi:MAG: UpxY family transcription antiterminator [Ferruginibacter sp.]|nr:UpxY family transcription antiterminator [Ferruginibacter sp.]
MEENNLHWFAVYTKPRWEKKVATILDEKGIENYCPLNKVVKQWSDRKKIVLEPVFKSYVFVRVPDAEKWELRSIYGIINFVYWLGKPARIKDQDIYTIRKFLHEFSDVEVEQNLGLTVNSKVRVKQGVLMNYQGILVELSGSRAKVRIESMGIHLSAQFDRKNLELVGQMGKFENGKM